MEESLTIPNILPVMTLPETVFYPHAILPLFIFEPRYREMLDDCLHDSRIFIVANEDKETEQRIAAGQSISRVATAGIIRASKEQEDGTSHLLLQGLVRVRMTSVVEGKPYRQVRIRAFNTPPWDETAVNILRGRVHQSLSQFLNCMDKMGGPVLAKLEAATDPETYLDLAVFSLCPDTKMKQQILEAAHLSMRYQLFNSWLDCEMGKLFPDA